jgi:hypothetical protein
MTFYASDAVLDFSDLGPSVRLHDAYVFLLQDGPIARHTPYRDIDEARAAAERLTEERA